jgi:hypothetical protein
MYEFLCKIKSNDIIFPHLTLFVYIYNNSLLAYKLMQPAIQLKSLTQVNENDVAKSTKK